MKKQFIKNICLICILALGVNLFPNFNTIEAKAADADVLFTYVRNDDMDVLQAAVPTPLPTGPQPTLIPKADMIVEYLDGSTSIERLKIDGLDWTKFYNSADPANTTQECTVSFGEYSGTAKNKAPYTTTVFVQLLGDFNVTIKSDNTKGGLVKFVSPITSISVEEITKKIRVGSSCKIEASVNDGYSFDGWYLGDAKKTSDKVYSFTMPAFEQSFVAKWTANKYKVTFDADGGVCSTESQMVTYDQSYGSLPAPTRKGYTFGGWYFGNTKITETDIVSTAANHILKAKWIAKTYEITFDANSGTMPNTAPNKIIIPFDKLYGYDPDFPTAANGLIPTKYGYTFNGWKYGARTITEHTKMNIDSSHTLTAEWIGNPVNITFNANGGTCDVSQKGVRYNTAYGALPTPVRDKHAFVGWVYNGSIVTELSLVSTLSTHELKAEWISINEESKEVRYDDYYGTLPEPLRTGYRFSGWFTNETIDHYATGERVYSYTIVKIAENHWLYARWTPLVWSVSFDTNGGSSCSAITVQYDYTYGALPVPIKTGYVFDGWYPAEINNDGFGEQITSETIVKLLGNQTLYAKWIEGDAVPEDQIMTVYFDANGGNCSTTTVCMALS